jgi:hypothetical protein
MNAGKPPAFLHARPFSFQRAGHDVCDLIPDEGDAGGCGEIEGDIGAPCPNASAVVDLSRVVVDGHLVLIFTRGNLEGAFSPSKTCLPRAESPLLFGLRTQPGAAQAEKSLPALPPEY